jgi:hypothetical protein
MVTRAALSAIDDGTTGLGTFIRFVARLITVVSDDCTDLWSERVD